ncbi:putative lipid II flippase FtsW [Patescibacteria group bacterium]|nr:putative lipid II flippase FtsW [Patescibacteria group bacterium]
MAVATKHRPDYTFFILVAGLALFGLLMILSAGQVQSFQLKGNGYYYFLQQIEALGIGLIGFYIAQRINYRWWKKAAVPLLVASLILLLLVFVPGIGFSYGGATRWINTGLFPLQASEIAKLALVIYLATWLSSKGSAIRSFQKTVLPFVGVIAAMGLLVMLEPDMGTTSILLMIGIVMFYTAGAAVRHIGILLGSALGAMALLVAVAPYRINRLLTFLDPTKDTLGTGYHVQQALVAIGSGGAFGLGFNNSIQKHFFLPEPMNDSIFAIIAEELGFFVAGAVIFAFGYLAVRGFRIARFAPDDFSRLLVTGIITWVVWQAMVNVAAMLSLVPLTGVTLPFISYGGSSLVVLMTAMGIVYNISKYTVKHREEGSHASSGRRRRERRTRRTRAGSFSRA